MGRDSKGYLTTGETLRIELSYLLKIGLIKKGCEISGSLSWTNGSSISIRSSYKTSKGNYIQLSYVLTKQDGEKVNYDYKIHLVTVKSNLGKGEILYLSCPNTGNNCRILYRCYYSPIWQSREAYSTRIYYQCQMSSKMSYWNDRFWQIEKLIEKLTENRRKQSIYKGRITRFRYRLFMLEKQREELDVMRWSPAAMPVSIRRELK